MTRKDEIVLKVENLSKVYRLGEVGTGTISHDINRWWAKVRGKEDPFEQVGAVNDRTKKAQKGEYVKVLNDINFEVKKGEVLGIIGKNGAGKSTLLKVISQITSPSSGSIKAKGRIASLLEVGTGMHPEMTGKENVYLNGTILGMTKKEIDDKFEEIMDFAGCAKYADTPVKRYSSGMKVRLGFAVAAFLEPEILIVDEVLAVGDAEFQKKAIGKMQDISAGGGRTVLFVSHNMRSVKSLCNQALLLENGMIREIGDVEHIVDSYLKMNDTSANEDFSFSNEDLSVLNTRFLDAKGKSNTVFKNNESIQIEFELHIHKNLSGVRLNIQLIDEIETIIFAGTDQKVNNGEYTPGVYTIQCAIPAMLLNEKNYSVFLSIGIQKIRNILQSTAIGSFRVVMVENKSIANFSKGKWPGAVAPELNWSLHKTT